MPNAIRVRVGCRSTQGITVRPTAAHAAAIRRCSSSASSVTRVSSAYCGDHGRRDLGRCVEPTGIELRTNGTASAPPINADEEEQPHDVHEVPVPCCRLEAEMMIGLEVSGDGAEEVHGEEARADDDMEAVEPRRHEEGRGIYTVFEAEGSM